MGAAGEQLAAEFLLRRSVVIESRNLRVGGGEIDIVARIGGRRVAIEVKSAAAGRLGVGDDPIEAFDEAKQRQVRRLADLAGCSRIDLITVVLSDDGVAVRWLPGAA